MRKFANERLNGLFLHSQGRLRNGRIRGEAMSQNTQYVAPAVPYPAHMGIVNAESQGSSLRMYSFSQRTLDDTSLLQGGLYGSE